MSLKFKCAFLIVRVTVSCFYMINDTQTIAFFTKPRENDPMLETGFGELHVALRLALGMLDYFNFKCYLLKDPDILIVKFEILAVIQLLNVPAMPTLHST